VSAARYEAAARHLADLSDAEAAAPLTQVLFVRAAVGHAQRGDLGAADRCLVDSGVTGPSLVVLRASAALVTGDRAEARKRARVEAPRQPVLLQLRASLSLPDADRSREEAKEALMQASESGLVERIRWLLVTLGVPTRGNRVVGEDELETPPRYRYTGFRTPLTSDEVRSANVDDALAVWHQWLAAANHRASRYLAFEHRGDAPEGLTPLLHAGARLADPEFTSEQTEMWLDALMAFDARRFTLRQVAFARWRAAAWRGDGKHARVWRDRYRKLTGFACDPKLADLLRAIRI
jgi:hypothetical protein